MNEAKQEICVDKFDKWKEMVNLYEDEKQDDQIGQITDKIVGIRKENRLLKSRVEQLEIANMNLTNHFQTRGNLEPN